MKIDWIIQEKILFTEKWFVIFTMIPDEDSIKNIPEWWFPEYWENFIKCLGIMENDNLFVGAKVSVEGNFQPRNEKYVYWNGAFAPKLEFNFKSNIDIIESLTSKNGLISFMSWNIPYASERIANDIIEYFWLDKTISALDWNKDFVIKELQNIVWVWKTKAIVIKETWDALAEERDSLIELFNLGLSLNKSMDVLRAWWNSYKSIIEEDPYNLVEIKWIGFTLADKIARKVLNLSEKDPRRYTALIEHIIIYENIKATWNSLIWKEDIISKIREFVLNEPSFTTEDINIIFNIWIKNWLENNKLIKINDNCYMSSNYFFAENKIAKKIIDLMLVNKDNKKFIEVLKKDKEDFDNKKDWALNEAQLKAKELMLSKGISLLVWWAGTWKTYLVGNIVNTLIDLWINYQIISPTNRAVSRVLEINPKANVSTIHSLLWLWIQSNLKTLKYNKDNPLPYTFLLIDESSMIDNYVAWLLFDAINPDITSVIFIGDPQQLPPVWVWSLFYDMIYSWLLDDRIARLNLVQRTWKSKFNDLIEKGVKWIKELKPWVHNIVSNSINILNWKLPIDTWFDCINKLIPKDSTMQKEEKFGYIKTQVVEVYNLLRKNWIDVNKDFQLYIPQYATEVWINSMNKFISDIINPNKPIKIDKYEYKINDKVVMDVNNEDFTKWDTWYITNIYPEEKEIDVFFYPYNKVIRIDSSNLQSLSLWYCVSVHKAQWTEVLYWAIILVSSFYMTLTKELLYTAYTRCKEKVFILWEERAYNIALHTDIKSKNTLLFHLLSWTKFEDIEPLNKNLKMIFNISDWEIKLVKNYILTTFLKENIEDYKIIKVGYRRNQNNSYFRYIISKKDFLNDLKLNDNEELSDDIITLLENNKDTYFVRIVKISSSNELNNKELRENKYRKDLLSDRKIICEINIFNKDINLVKY